MNAKNLKPDAAHSAHYADILNKMSGAKVIVIGDIMLDRFVYGHVERISPESPVPVLSVERENMMLGGAGNALTNLATLGAKGQIFSLIGADEAGRTVRGLINDLGFDDGGLIENDARPTIVKTRFLAGHQQLLRCDEERKGEIDKEQARDFAVRFEEAVTDAGAVIVSDYGKGLLGKWLLAKIMRACRKAKVPVIVDPKGFDYSIYKGASVVTPNKKELAEATAGMAVDSDEEVLAASHALIKKAGIDAVVATRSKDGMSIIRKGAKDALNLRSTNIEVFDVSGAGDTVIATIAAGLAAGASLEDAAVLANIAGSVVVSKVGTAPIRAEELHEALEDDAHHMPTVNGDKQPEEARKIMGSICGWDEAAEQVQRWKARGLKVGFTNGCFDILHYGHVSYLAQARGACDRLIVGLNHDKSVKILKGDERPVHDENARATVLAALGSVDMVTFFGAENPDEANTANELLSKIQPDIYFKGGDYKVEDIPETPAVQAYGGEVCVMSVFEGHSTTGSIAKMKKGEAA